MGSSYFWPVRLSVTVSVSAIVLLVRLDILVWNGLGGHAVLTVDPLGKILKLAALAAERLPRRLRRLASPRNTFYGTDANGRKFWVLGAGFWVRSGFWVRGRRWGFSFRFGVQCASA